MLNLPMKFTSQYWNDNNKGYWLEKSIDRFSMSHLYSHKGFFSSSYNLKKTFGTLFNGHGLTQLANIPND